MTFTRRNWYNIALILGIATLVWQAFARYEGVQLILLLSLAVIFFHQFEEYAFPGGEAWILNEVFQQRGGPANRYPLNQNNALFINVALWPAYFIPVFFPDLIWLGFAPLLIGAIGQFLIHGIITNSRLKTIYNPGFLTVVIGWLPLTVWYIVEVYQNDMISGWDWLFTVLYAIALVASTFGPGYTVMASRTSPYPFDLDEMTRWDRVRRLTRAGITPLPLEAE